MFQYSYQCERRRVDRESKKDRDACRVREQERKREDCLNGGQYYIGYFIDDYSNIVEEMKPLCST